MLRVLSQAPAAEKESNVSQEIVIKSVITKGTQMYYNVPNDVDENPWSLEAMKLQAEDAVEHRTDRIMLYISKNRDLPSDFPPVKLLVDCGTRVVFSVEPKQLLAWISRQPK